MKPVFNERKATQIAASFIKLCGGRLNYMKLIKLMYLADREALLKWGRPITYDSYFSLKHGPILSTTLDLIHEGKQPDSEHIWFQYVSTPERFEVTLRQDCSPDDLSQAEESVISLIFEKYGHYDKWELVDLLHSILPEWQNPNCSSIPITYRDILKAGGKSEEEINYIEEEISEVCFAADIFGS
ncbi:MAG: Panacea domain-containing protein [Nostoc sp. ChiSLP01]|nr:Panacea domain-containing protein [Nostoc sp. CmiSLP01]MDZ8284514.1 Panacea domain-containing protein [Nostoc sp. ChiSLP01]